MCSSAWRTAARAPGGAREMACGAALTNAAACTPSWSACAAPHAGAQCRAHAKQHREERSKHAFISGDTQDCAAHTHINLPIRQPTLKPPCRWSNQGITGQPSAGG